MNRTIYYALDNDPLYVFCLLKSLRSLRRVNKRIPARVFIYGKINPRDRAALARLGARIEDNAAVSKKNVTLLKWMSLKKLNDSGPILFCDTDTLFFRDPAELFRSCSSRDFYAREELGTRPGCGVEFVGIRRSVPQLENAFFDKLTRTLGARRLPVFNTGVMLFNGGIHVDIARRLNDFERIRVGFESGSYVYPSWNPHLLDELLASLTLGQIPRLTYGLLEKKQSPWYVEWKGGEVTKPGIVMHLWTSHYQMGLEDFGSPRERTEFSRLMDSRKGQRFKNSYGLSGRVLKTIVSPTAKASTGV